MRRLVLLAGLGSVLLLAVGSYALADGGSSNSNVDLIGYQEVPSVSTDASGKFKAKIRGDRIEWTLSYRELEGTVQQAHIHFAETHVNGGISVFLCTNLGNGPAGIRRARPLPRRSAARSWRRM